MSLTDPILQFQQTRTQVPFQPPTVCTAETFPILLAGVPALRKVPGLATLEDAGEAYFTSIPYCLSGEDRQKTREHLEQVYGITDRDSMAAFCQNELWVHPEYLDFESFWEGRPAFSLDELNPGARTTFQRLSGFARQFQPFVGRRGFLAWDISETLGHLRMACACDLISPQEYKELSQHWVEQAAAFHSWDEYAVGLVCGAAYWAFRMGGGKVYLVSGGSFGSFPLEGAVAQVMVAQRRQRIADRAGTVGFLSIRVYGENTYGSGIYGPVLPRRQQ